MKRCSTKPAITKSAQQFALQIGCIKWFLLCLWIVFAFNSSLAQNVGIGIDAPTQKLEVAGSIKGSNLLTTGFVGINTLTPLYRLHLNDGSFAISSSADNTTWVTSYNSSFNYLNFAYNGTSRMTLLNNGNLGIGTTAPAYKLDVNGAFHADKINVTRTMQLLTET